jgi:RNA polymerase sigma factor (TIGR02999 family)
MSEITEQLGRAAAGEAGAQERLYELLYRELKRLARGHLARVGPITLDPTAIVHEVWMRSRSADPATSRSQFFAHASSVMRSVIVDHVRERQALKRGGGNAPVTLETAALNALPGHHEVLQVDEALRALAKVDERCHRVVEMRYFGGLTEEEVAQALGLSVPTIKRDWRRARAFLFDYLRA